MSSGRSEGRGVQERGTDTHLGNGGHHHRCYEASSPRTDIPRILPLLQAAKRTRCFGSTALDLAYLASGAISVFATGTASRAFDYAAGMLILEEADGVITDLAGDSLDYIVVGLDGTVPLLASANEKLHVWALNVLSETKQPG